MLLQMHDLPGKKLAMEIALQSAPRNQDCYSRYTDSVLLYRCWAGKG